MDDLPKCNQYEDDHGAEIEVVCSKRPAACHWQKEDHLQFRCDNHLVHNSHDSDEEETENLRDMEVVLNPELQPFTYSDFQIPNESLKPETNCDLIQNNSVPLFFNSFQILKKTLGQVLKDKYIKSQEISFESMQQSC